MKKIWLGLLGIALAAVVCGLLARRHALKLDVENQEFAQALEAYYQGVEFLRGGNIEASQERLAVLRALVEAHKAEAAWQALEPYARQLEGLSAYAKAQEQWITYVRIFTTQSKEPLPDAKEILDGYGVMETAYAGVLGKPGFSDPEIAWRLENDIATAKVWQLVTRWAMQKSNFEELKPLYDTALTRYKKAMEHARKVHTASDDFSDPARYVSQNLDFMTRLGEAMQQQQQEGEGEGDGNENEGEGEDQQGPQRKGLGDFLSRALAQARQGQGNPQGFGKMLSQGPPGQNQLFLPLPMKGIGTSRLPSAGKK